MGIPSPHLNHQLNLHRINMEVSWNMGTPNHRFFPLITTHFGWFWGTIILGNPHLPSPSFSTWHPPAGAHRDRPQRRESFQRAWGSEPESCSAALTCWESLGVAVFFPFFSQQNSWDMDLILIPHIQMVSYWHVLTYSAKPVFFTANLRPAEPGEAIPIDCVHVYQIQIMPEWSVHLHFALGNWGSTLDTLVGHFICPLMTENNASSCSLLPHVGPHSYELVYKSHYIDLYSTTYIYKYHTHYHYYHTHYSTIINLQ
jgi:hypothetical protein